jgi:hypothetical protein
MPSQTPISPNFSGIPNKYPSVILNAHMPIIVVFIVYLPSPAPFNPAGRTKDNDQNGIKIALILISFAINEIISEFVVYNEAKNLDRD